MTDDDAPVLELRGLKKHFSQNVGFLNSLLNQEQDQIQAVDDVSLTLHRNESIGVIGESGCGKTTLLRTVGGLYDPTDGQILYKGRDTSEFNRQDWKEFRSNVQMIFQDPYNTLDPKMTVRESLQEPLNIHDFDNKEERIVDMLEQVELEPPERYLDRLPKHLSGGEKQRASIARSLIIEPEIVLADEPVSMLDVSTQASILNLLPDLRDEYDLALLYISHDLSTVSYVCDSIRVMYLGRVMESALTQELIDNPKHPYSKALVQAIPIPDPHANRDRSALDSSPRDPIGIGEGCRFRDRCPDRMEVCEKTPHMVEEGKHDVACHLYYDHNAYDVESDVEGNEQVINTT